MTEHAGAFVAMARAVLDPVTVAYLRRAVVREAAELRRDGVRLPAGLAEVAEGLREAQGVAPLPAIPDLPQAGPVALLLTYARVAEQLDCSVSTVERLVEAGRLPVVRLRSSPRVRASDLAEFVAALADGADGPRLVAS